MPLLRLMPKRPPPQAITALSVCTAIVILSGASSCTPRAGDTARPRPQDDITRSELEQVLSESAYNAIEQLRPSWLFHRRIPTPTNPNPAPTAYVDRARLRGLDELYTIPVEDVERIQFLTASDATTLFGTGHLWGAIVVTTRRPGR